MYTSAFGITAGVHRLWSHKAYRASWQMRFVLMLLFTVTGQVGHCRDLVAMELVGAHSNNCRSEEAVNYRVGPRDVLTAAHSEARVIPRCSSRVYSHCVFNYS